MNAHVDAFDPATAHTTFGSMRAKRKSFGEQRQLAAKAAAHTGFVIDPRNSPLMPVWDMIMLMALSFVSVVTPFEVTFLDERSVSDLDTLFFINRVVDLCFLVDMFLCFNLSYQESAARGAFWVHDKSMIIKKYLRGWFIIDFVSILPFYVVGWVMDVDDKGSGSEQGRSASSLLASVRAIKLLRMIKLARVLKASRIIKRHMYDVLMTKLELTYAMITMVRMLLLLLLWAHWQACLWALGSSFMDGRTWVTEFENTWEGADSTRPDPLDLYSAALYWSVMTLTSIGYGAMLPITTGERILCSIYMIISGMIWTYVIGTAAGIAATLDPNGVLFHTTMDQLNEFMRERTLPKDMRLRLREYFQFARQVHQVTDDTELLAKMSPMLQGTVALASNKRWLDRVWFFKTLGDTREELEFIAAIARHLQIKAYAVHERLPIGQLYVLRRGLAVKLWRFLGAGKVWGEDMILDSPELIDHAQAVAITFVEVYTLTREDLDDQMELFPSCKAKVVRAAKKIATTRAVLLYLKVQLQGQPVRCFVPRSVSRGAQYVKKELTLDHKLDTMLEAQQAFARRAFLQQQQQLSSLSVLSPSQRPSSQSFGEAQRGSDGGAGVCLSGGQLRSVDAGSASQPALLEGCASRTLGGSNGATVLQATPAAHGGIAGMSVAAQGDDANMAVGPQGGAMAAAMQGGGGLSALADLQNTSIRLSQAIEQLAKSQAEGFRRLEADQQLLLRRTLRPGEQASPLASATHGRTISFAPQNAADSSETPGMLSLKFDPTTDPLPPDYCPPGATAAAMTTPASNARTQCPSGLGGQPSVSAVALPPNFDPTTDPLPPGFGVETLQTPPKTPSQQQRPPRFQLPRDFDPTTDPLPACCGAGEGTPTPSPSRQVSTLPPNFDPTTDPLPEGFGANTLKATAAAKMT